MALSQEQIDRLDASKAGQGFTPKSKANRAQPQPQTPPQALALPGQGKVLLQNAIAQTQAQIAAVDRVADKSEEVVLAHFDRRMADLPGRVALKVMERMGITPDSPEAIDFFDETPLDIDGEFAKLLAPKAPALVPQPEPEAQRVLAEVV